MSKSKARGTRFENEIRDRLNEIDGVDALRVVGSGMFAQGDPTSDLYGDVRAHTRIGELIIEGKWRTTSGWKTLEKWLESHDALVMRSPSEPAYVFMPWSVFAKLLEDDGIVEAARPLQEKDLADLNELISSFLSERLKPQSEKV